MEKAEWEEKTRAARACWEDLVFERFDSTVAWQLGCMLHQKAEERGLCIAASVTLNRRRLFYMAMDGTAPVNERWIARKENTVYTFFESSYEKSLYMKLKNDSIGPRYGLNGADYAAAGGSVPVQVRGMGIAGTVTVSGLTEEEDHTLAAEVMREYLEEQERRRV